jgi:hypothetical protein
MTTFNKVVTITVSTLVAALIVAIGIAMYWSIAVIAGY